MASASQNCDQRAGDSGNLIRTPAEGLPSRLVERHAQISRSREQKANVGPTGFEKSFDFLPRFLDAKSEILANLNAASDKVSNSSVSAAEVTHIIDDTVLRLEELQKSLNDAALYLTSFDLEQARLELKSLNSEFQIKREQLIPTRKFCFSRKAKAPSSVTESAKSENAVQAAVDETRQHHAQSLKQYHPDFTWTNIHDQRTLFIPKSTDSSSIDISGQTVVLDDLSDCIVHILGVCGNIIASRLNRCRIYTYPVAGSVWVENCQDCDLVTACRQLRIHKTQNCRLGLQMASRPIIEQSSNLHVAPYALNHPGLSAQLAAAGLTEDVNLWREVEDFSHPNKRMTTGSPNWSVLPESEWSSLTPQASVQRS